MRYEYTNHRPGTGARANRPRKGMSLIEVMVAMGILGGVLIALGMFSIRLSHTTSDSRIRVDATQLAADRLEAVKGAPRYTAIESLFVKTEASIPGWPGFARRTQVKRIGGTSADTIDYKIVTVQVTHKQLFGSVRKTTTIAPF